MVAAERPGWNAWHTIAGTLASDPDRHGLRLKSGPVLSPRTDSMIDPALANGIATAGAPRRSDQVVTRPRVLLVASAGGHWIELARLSAAFEGCECQFVSTAGGMVAPDDGAPVLQIRDSSRDTLPDMLRSVRAIWKIIREHRPDIVVSTGAAPGAIALVLAKLHGARTVWIDSIANGDELSMSGRAVLPFADLRLTQWAHLTKRYRHLRYFGQIL
ncbi:hypothetical protein ASE78_04510 [Sphingomonas sp. Leaf25]|nr:hypothetical protein ASE78_04510 [Sphingomonas sp. Leaf25]